MEETMKSSVEGEARERGKVGFIGLKDLVLSVLLSCLALLISVGVMIPLGMLDMAASMLLGGALPPLICGIIYVLMMAKSPRIGTCFVFSAVFGAFYVASGSLTTGVFFLVAGVLAELSMIGGRGTRWRPVVPYMIHWLCYAYAATLQFIFMRGVLIDTYVGMGMDVPTAEATVETLAGIMTDPTMMVVSGAIAVICSVVGYWIGTKVFGKRFKSAGIA